MATCERAKERERERDLGHPPWPPHPQIPSLCLDMILLPAWACIKVIGQHGEQDVDAAKSQTTIAPHQVVILLRPFTLDLRRLLAYRLVPNGAVAVLGLPSAYFVRTVRAWPRALVPKGLELERN